MTGVAAADLEKSISTSKVVVGLLRDEQLGVDTPCEEWSVADLLGHLVDMLAMYGTAFGSVQPEPGQSDAPGVTGFAERFTAASTRLLEAVNTVDPDSSVSVPFGTVPVGVATRLATVEVLVHGWDLAKATGQPYGCDHAVAERALGFSASALGDVPPDRSPFAAPVPVEDDAPAVDRLAALLGRHP
jgi:uncharacterized protein (TIGR03086 family)